MDAGDLSGLADLFANGRVKPAPDAPPEMTFEGREKVLELYRYDMSDVLEKQQGVKHACEAETSVMMHLFPDKVREAEIEDFETPSEEFGPYLLHEKSEKIEGSPGNQGYPSHASAEKGRELFFRMKEHALGWLLEHGLRANGALPRDG